MIFWNIILSSILFYPFLCFSSILLYPFLCFSSIFIYITVFPTYLAQVNSRYLAHTSDVFSCITESVFIPSSDILKTSSPPDSALSGLSSPVRFPGNTAFEMTGWQSGTESALKSYPAALRFPAPARPWPSVRNRKCTSESPICCRIPSWRCRSCRCYGALHHLLFRSCSLPLKKESAAAPFSFRPCDIHSEYMMAVLRIGIPSAVQGAVFCFANIFAQASVNGFGASAIAGSTIAMNFEYFTYYVITAFGQTATTFTSQNHSAGQTKRCRKILRICMMFSVLGSLLLIEPLILFRSFFTGIFSVDQAVIRHACLRTLWICTVFRQSGQLRILYYAFPLSWLLTIYLVVLGFFMIKP